MANIVKLWYQVLSADEGANEITLNSGERLEGQLPMLRPTVGVQAVFGPSS